MVGRGDKVNRLPTMPLYSPAVEKPQQPGALSPHTKERAFVLTHYLIQPTVAVGQERKRPSSTAYLVGAKKKRKLLSLVRGRTHMGRKPTPKVEVIDVWNAADCRGYRSP